MKRDRVSGVGSGDKLCEVFTVSHEIWSEPVRTGQIPISSDQNFSNHFASQIAEKLQIFLIRFWSEKPELIRTSQIQVWPISDQILTSSDQNPIFN